MLNSGALLQPSNVGVPMRGGCVPHAEQLYPPHPPHPAHGVPPPPPGGDPSSVVGPSPSSLCPPMLTPAMHQQMHFVQQQHLRMLATGPPEAVHYPQPGPSMQDVQSNAPPNAQFSRGYYDYGNPLMQRRMPPPMQTQMSGEQVPVEGSMPMGPPVYYPGGQLQSPVSSAHHGTATANDPCAQIAHVLQCYQQGGEDAEFVRKAIESLVKKLKDKRTELENLITAITSAGKQATSCVTIQRSLDGRLQVAGRKGVPHVVYARIWRWPNVTKNELQKLPICAVAADNQDVICINPYHYERIVSSGIGNIDMSTLRLDSLTPCSSAPAQNNILMSPVPSTAMPPMSTVQSMPMPGMHVEQPQHSFGDTSCQASPSMSMMPNGPSDSQSNPWIGQGCVMNPSPSSQQLYPQIQGSVYPMRDSSGNNYGAPSSRYDLSVVQLPATSVPDHWCSISYYELDTQIGETFKVRKEQSEVIIDGGVNPAGAKHGRFCLGALSNVHRSEASEKARLHIGKGVRISTLRDGSVYLECLSHKSVFVRSYYLDFERGLEYGVSVYKFSSGAPNKKIFDLRWAYAEMEQQSKSARLAVVAQAAAVAGYVSASSLTPSLIEHAGTGVDDLRRVCCTIAISFVKGWGSRYSRTSIKETPCWVELQLHRPLQLLDQLLKKNEYYGCD